MSTVRIALANVRVPCDAAGIGAARDIGRR
jgi:hypothetical protein